MQAPTSECLNAHRWGIDPVAIGQLTEELRLVWQRYQPCFHTRTRDGSGKAWIYLRGLLTMDDHRTFTTIARRVQGVEADGQNVQQFMSDSPWDAMAVIRQVQAELAATPEFQQGGVLIVDESAVEKASAKTAGAGRQHNGRLGKIEMSQVGTLLGFAKGTLWTWIDGELYLPEAWFGPDKAASRQRLGVPPERRFATKIELAWQMIQRVRVPYEAVLCDDLYGRNQHFRRQMDETGILYLGDIPANTLVYLTRPEGQCVKGKFQLSNEAQALTVTQVGQQVPWVRFQVRATERGELDDAFAMSRVWSLRDGQVAEEWVVIRQEGAKRTYALSNAPAATPPERLVWLKCGRFAMEAANHDAKSDLGWDELQAQKYRAWEHHLALTILAAWFIAQVKLRWARATPPDPTLASDLGIERLPPLSLTNVRELLKATLPLPQLTQTQATQLVVSHLVHRSQATASRLRKRRKTKKAP